jgi:hypothetical protein
MRWRALCQLRDPALGIEAGVHLPYGERQTPAPVTLVWKVGLAERCRLPIATGCHKKGICFV